MNRRLSMRGSVRNGNSRVNATERVLIEERLNDNFSINLSDAQIQQELLKVKGMDDIVSELKSRLNGVKAARSDEEKENRLLGDRARKLMIDTQQKESLMDESKRWKENIALEAQKLSDVWNIENRNKLLTDARLSENVVEVRFLNDQIKCTNELLEKKRRAFDAWQSSSMHVLHKDEIDALNRETSEIAEKIHVWETENNHLVSIADAMKEEESVMESASYLARQKVKIAQEECQRMKCRIIYLSSVIDGANADETQSDLNKVDSSDELEGWKHHSPPDLSDQQPDPDAVQIALHPQPQSPNATEQTRMPMLVNDIKEREEELEGTQEDEERNAAGGEQMDDKDLSALHLMMRRFNAGFIDQINSQLAFYKPC